MTTRMLAAAVAAVLLVSVAAQAHVSISPRDSLTGATEKYTVRIPTEGTVATTAAELDVPEGVTVETLQVPAGWTYDVRRADDRVVAIVWHVNVKPGEFLDVAFVARNPRNGARLVWKLRQRFADGTVTDWTTAPNGSTRPTAVTTLAAPPAR